MINYENLHIEGFASIVEPLDFKLDRGNLLNVIRGKVGEGKTSIPNALTWCLYGKSLKDKSTITTWPERQPKNYRGTMVFTTFTKLGNNYKIIRCKSFKGNINIGGKKIKGGNNIFVIENDVPLDTKGKINIQTEINKIIGYSYELFKNSLVVGQKMKRIIEESGPDKKKIFDEAFETGFIDEAKNLVIDERKKLIEAKNTIENKLDILDVKLDSREKLLKDALQHEKDFEKHQKNSIDFRVKLIDKTKEQIEAAKELVFDENEYGKLLKIKGKLENKLNVIKINNNRFLELENSIKDLQRKINNKETELKKGYKTCSECGQPINKKDSDRLKEEANKDIKKYKKELKVLQDGYMAIEHEDTSILTKEINDNNVEIGLLERNRNKLKSDNNNITKLETEIKKLKSEIKEVEADKLKVKSTLYTKLISKLEKRYKKLNKSLIKIESDINIKDWLINDPLSNNGLKAYIFDALLVKVNDRLFEYSKILGFQIEFGINLETNRKDFYQLIMMDNIIIPYEDLSGGQKQLVDTTVAFAIHDVIADIKPTNIMFLDEPFESLDYDYIEVVAELISEKAKYKSVFLITHHQGFSAPNSETIYVESDENKHTTIR